MIVEIMRLAKSLYLEASNLLAGMPASIAPHMPARILEGQGFVRIRHLNCLASTQDLSEAEVITYIIIETIAA